MSIRVQVTVDPVVHGAAKQEAKRRGLTLSAFIREAMIAALPVDDAKPWMKYAGMLKTGDPNSSRKIDEIYDNP